MPLSPSSSAQAAREALASRLKALLQDAGLSGHDLAVLCGWSDSKSSRIMNARTPPSDSDIRAWCSACGAGDQAADLIAANRAADSMYVEWKKVHRSGMKQAQDDELLLLSRTRLTRAYCSNVAPGVIQTIPYASALMSTITSFQGTLNDVEAAVHSRASRSRLLREGNHRFAFLLEETVLHYPIGDSNVMVGQLEVMLEVMKLPRVSLGVIPFTAPRRMWPLEAFYMYDDRQVTAELLSAIVNITAPGEIAVYDQAFKILAGMAVYGDHARALIDRVIRAHE